MSAIIYSSISLQAVKRTDEKVLEVKDHAHLMMVSSTWHININSLTNVC